MPTVVTQASQTDELLAEEARQRAEKAPKNNSGTPVVVPIKLELLFQWPDGQTAVCARAQVMENGEYKLTEEWRPVRKEEEALLAQARVIRGGPVAPVPEPEKKYGWLKWVAGGAGLLTVGGLAIVYGPKAAEAIQIMREEAGVDDAADEEEDEDCDDEE